MPARPHFSDSRKAPEEVQAISLLLCHGSAKLTVIPEQFIEIPVRSLDEQPLLFSSGSDALSNVFIIPTS